MMRLTRIGAFGGVGLRSGDVAGTAHRRSAGGRRGCVDQHDDRGVIGGRVAVIGAARSAARPAAAGDSAGGGRDRRSGGSGSWCGAGVAVAQITICATAISGTSRLAPNLPTEDQRHDEIRQCCA